MTLNLLRPDSPELQPKLIVFGVGGAGGNAVNNMLMAELEGVEFIAANTDAQALAGSRAVRKIQLGAGLTQGLGAGSKPEVGAQAAESSLPDILDALSGAHMVFITAGMGGGTGTGAAPVIARAARDQGILTVGVVTKPFNFEGPRRMRVAEEGIIELQKHVDTLIIIPNQNLFRVANEKTTFAQAFALADEVLHSGVRGITDLMVIPGLMNLDFADVRTVMSEMGKAMMGTGEAEGPKRAIEAAEAAIANPLLDDVSMKGARGVLIHITGGMDLTLFEVDEAANRIRNECDPDANIKVGSTFDSRLDGRLRVSVVATGIEAELRQQAEPAPTTRKGLEPVAAKRTMVTGGMRAPAAASEPQAASQPQNPVHLMQEEIARKAPASEAPVAADDGTLELNTPVRPASPDRRPALASPPKLGAGARAMHEPFPELRGQGSHPAGRIAPPRTPGPLRPPPLPQAEPPRKPVARSFFDRVTGRRGRDTDDGPEGGLRAPPETPAPRRPDPGTNETLFRDAPAEDQLEIPAFLRRSAN